MKKVLFVDRDGTLILEPEDEQIDSLEKLEFYPGVFQWLGKIVAETDYELVMVTNQDGLGTASFPEHTFWPAHRKMLKAFENEGIRFHDVLIDRSLPEENKPTRKPGIGMLGHYLSGAYDFSRSYVIGDRVSDIELAKNLGCKAVFLHENKELPGHELKNNIALSTTKWSAIYDLLVRRRAAVERKTRETEISIDLNLDGSGEADIITGLAFFDHMLEQIAKHGLMDLRISVKGDLEVDEHHTIEDTAIALGEAFQIALGSKKGISRYGFMLPMDDCLARVAIDFGGRNWIVWEADFKREMVGKMPTEMFFHFFKSFSDAARCNLNIRAEGTNEHHKIEAIFKAFARAVRMAVKRDGSGLPSTKGVI